MSEENQTIDYLNFIKAAQELADAVKEVLHILNQYETLNK